MVRGYLILLLGVWICGEVQAQTRTISGYVRDQANGESLIGATVVDTQLKKGAITNTFGFYSLTVTGDSARFSYSFVGYSSKSISIRVMGDTSIIVLLSGGRMLDEVTIQGQRAEKIHESSRTGTVNLPVAQIKNVPMFAGEADVLKALQLLPGVSGGNEGSSNILVRGGTPDQTLILMDGVPIYNPSHLYGLVSSFNPDAVNNVELVKSGFPARYGGRLSGIADITLREGNSNRFGAQGTAGVFASRLLFEGPIIKGRTSFLVSGRASYLGLMKLILVDQLGQASLEGYKFHDINAKINHRINSKNRLYASLYQGGDRMKATSRMQSADSVVGNEYQIQDFRATDRVTWGNLLTSLRWNHEINATRFFNVTAYMSDYDLTIENETTSYSMFEPAGRTQNREYRYKYQSSIRDLGVKIDFDHIPSTKHYIRYGATAVHHRFNPAVGGASGSDSTLTVDPVNSPTNTNELSAYFEDDVNISAKLKINAGLHGVVYGVSGKTYAGIQPRLSMRYLSANNTAFKVSYSYMQQFLQTLANAGLGFPTELWVPTTAKVKPQTSHQVSIGVAKTIKYDMEFSIEAFYKTMDNLLEYEEGASYLDNDQPWDSKVTSGRGRAYGAEVFLQKKIGRLTGFAGYTLSWNERKFEEINNNEWYFYRFDRRHDIKATANYQFNNKHFDLSVNYVFSTGNAVTVPLSIYPGAFPLYSSGTINGVPYVSPQTLYLTEYQRRGSFRMPSYHRADINLNFTFVTGRVEHKASIGAYNLYNRKNPFYLQYNLDRRSFIPVSLFPLMPSLSYSIKL